MGNAAFEPLGPEGELPEDVAVAAAGNTPYGELVERIDDGGGGGTGGTGLALPVTPAADDGGDEDDGGLLGAVRAVARGLRLFFSDPRHALLLLTAWALLGSPAVLSRRRRLLGDVGTG